MVMIRANGKAKKIAEQVLKGKGVKLPDSIKKDKVDLDVQYKTNKGKK